LTITSALSLTASIRVMPTTAMVINSAITTAKPTASRVPIFRFLAMFHGVSDLG
jgi:hypothetical protein